MGGGSSCRDEDVEEELVQSKPLARKITPLILRQVDAVEEEEEDLDEATIQPKLISAAPPTLQRQEAPEEEEEEPAEGMIQPKLISSYIPTFSPSKKTRAQKPLSNPAIGCFIQAKLKIGESGDRYEQEADRVAHRVMHMPAQRPTIFYHTTPVVHRQAESSSVSLRRKPSVNNARVKNRPTSQPCSQGKESFPGDAGKLTSGGSPLPADLRTFYESRFGYDFSGVRTHTGPDAEHSSAGIRAQAFTFGRHVWFGLGHRPSRDWLTAHELTHVLQYGDLQGGDKCIRRVPAGCPGDPDTPPLPAVDDFAQDESLNAVRLSVFESKPMWLGKGDADEGVAMLQELLLNTLYTGIDRATLHLEWIDGVFGNATRKAVQAYQRTHQDAIGRALDDDGRVGPLTLGALDGDLGLPVLPPAKAAKGKGECFGTAEQGPGGAARLLPAKVPAYGDYQPNDAVWMFTNFDVARHFVKTEHRELMRGSVVPVVNALPKADTELRIIGEASTTGSDAFNQALSDRRAACTRTALLDAGLDDPTRIKKEVGYGEAQAKLLLLMSGASPWDGVEDRHARRSAIVLKTPAGEDCDKTQASSRFQAYVACESAISVRVHIGDRSNPAQPIYREFRWMHLPWPSGCGFLAGVPPPFLPAMVDFGTDKAFHLAIRDPERIDAPTEFAGAATHRSAPTTHGFVSSLEGGLNPFYLPMGATGWVPAACGTDIHDTLGMLTPIGPVHCGDLPVPSWGPCTPPKDDEDCPDAYLLTAAQKYIGAVFGGSADISRVLPPWARPFVPLGLSGALVTLCTTDLPDKQLMRVFLHAGISLSGAGADLDKLAAAGSHETDVGSPVQLQNGDAGVVDLIFGDSDFRMKATSDLTLKGKSNRIDLETGAGDFSFFGLHCNHGGERNYKGPVRPIGSAFCVPEPLPDIAFPERSCADEPDCPEATRLAGHDHFRIRVGRLTTRGLPPGLADRAATAGCKLVAAELHVDTEGDAGDLIHREFVLLAIPEDCGFTVGRGDVTIDLLFDRQLATETPDATDAGSDFIGGAMLGADRKLTIIAGTHLPITFELPGAHESGCKGSKAVRGPVLPTGVVDCGPAPEPAHDTRPEVDHRAHCEAIKAGTSSMVDTAAARLKAGDFDPLIARLRAAPKILVPPVDYQDWLAHKKVGDVVSPAFFVGRAPAAARPSGTTVPGLQPVVAFAHLRILAINSDHTMIVEFLTDLCAFDADGNVVMMRPDGCADGFIRAGNQKQVGTLRF